MCKFHTQGRHRLQRGDWMPPATRSRMPNLHDEGIVAVSLRLVSPNGMPDRVQRGHQPCRVFTSEFRLDDIQVAYEAMVARKAVKPPYFPCADHCVAAVRTQISLEWLWRTSAFRLSQDDSVFVPLCEPDSSWKSKSAKVSKTSVSQTCGKMFASRNAVGIVCLFHSNWARWAL